MTAIDSPVTPELPPWLDDVVISVGRVPTALDGEPSGSGALWRATRREFWLQVPGVARYLVSGGGSINLQPAAGAQATDIARLARSTLLAAICYQRGIPVLHAAGAVREGTVVLLAGDSSVGKSTLLAELLRRGWRMVGDDLAPVVLDQQGYPTVLPTYPELALWPDAIRRLPSELAHPELGLGPGGQRILSTEDRFISEPCRLDSIWWLTAHNRDKVEVDPRTGGAAFHALGDMSYNSRIARALLDPGVFLRVGAAVAEVVAVTRADRPRATWTVGELGDLVEGAAGSPAPGKNPPFG